MWRIYELGNIAREQRVADYSRLHPDLPKQMLTAFKEVEDLKQGDHFFNDTGIEIVHLASQVMKQGLQDDERLKTISAEVYQKHADNLLAKTT